MSRIILKISGEALKIDSKNVSNDKLNIILETINILRKYNHKIAIVIGGGNFFRGRENTDMNEVTRDTIGMLGTVMNSLYIKDYLEKNNVKCLVSTPFLFPDLIDKYSNKELLNMYNSNEIIIFGGGFGKSGYSTDSGVVLANNILNTDLIIKMTNVDGVYNKDPHIYDDAKKFNKLSYDEIIKNDYKVMDMFAIEDAMKKNIKILVMNFNKYMDLNTYFEGNLIGTEVSNER